jgi:muconolactone delta-isomerase
MRFVLIYRPKDAIGRESMPEMLAGMGEWMQKHGSRVEDVEFFVGGGGLGYVETDDAEDLARLIADNPFSPYSEIEVRPLVAPERGMAIQQEALG